MHSLTVNRGIPLPKWKQALLKWIGRSFLLCIFITEARKNFAAYKYSISVYKNRTSLEFFVKKRGPIQTILTENYGDAHNYWRNRASRRRGNGGAISKIFTLKATSSQTLSKKGNGWLCSIFLVPLCSSSFAMSCEDRSEAVVKSRSGKTISQGIAIILRWDRRR